MLEKSRENHMYTTIPPTLEDNLTWEELYEEPDYNKEYEIIFGNIYEENREFIDYEDNYIDYLLNSTNKKEDIK